MNTEVNLLDYYFNFPCPSGATSIREIIKAVAEDEELGKLIGQCIVNAPLSISETHTYTYSCGKQIEYSPFVGSTRPHYCRLRDGHEGPCSNSIKDEERKIYCKKQIEDSSDPHYCNLDDGHVGDCSITYIVKSLELCSKAVGKSNLICNFYKGHSGSCGHHYQ